MTSDPSYGTTGFFSFLWVKRKPVFDVDETVQLTNDTGRLILTADTGVGPPILVSDDVKRLIRWV